MDDLCILCNDPLGPTEVSHVTSKGQQSLVSASAERADGLEQRLSSATSLVVHTECRKNYTRKSSIESLKRKSASVDCTDMSPKLQLRSSLRKFDFKLDCLFCAEEIDENSNSQKSC